MQGQDGDVEGLLRGSCRKAKDDVAGGLGGSPRALWKDFPRRGRRDCSAFISWIFVFLTNAISSTKDRSAPVTYDVLWLACNFSAFEVSTEVFTIG